MSTTASLLPAEAHRPTCASNSLPCAIPQGPTLPGNRSEPPYRVHMPESGVARRPVTDPDARHASRQWWDSDADRYQAEHGGFLGDVDLVWCPEGLREADAGLLG